MLAINLLPTKEQRAFEYARLAGVLLRFGLGSLLVLLVVAASLFFMKAALNQQLASTEERLQRLFLNERVKAVLETDRAVADFNVLLKKADTLEGSRVAWSKTLTFIANAAGEGVKLKQLMLNSTDQTITLSGEAATRAAMLAYGEALRAQPLVTQVDSPLANLVKERDVTFNLTLHLK